MESVIFTAVKMTDSTLVLAHTGSGYDGYIRTFKVASDGTTIKVIQTPDNNGNLVDVSLEHDGSYGQWNSLVRARTREFH